MWQDEGSWDPTGGTGGSIGGVAGLIGIGAGLLDSHYDRKTARENTEKTIAAQKEQAELAYQRELEMWHMQNAYNSPAQQMQRFGAAGLNPQLIYGQGNSGNASTMAKYQAPNLQYRYHAPTYGAAVQSLLPTLMSVGSWMQNMRLTEAEIANKESTGEKLQQLIGFLQEKNPRELQRMDQALSVFPYQKSLMEAKEQTAWTAWNQLLHEGRHKYGDSIDAGAGHEGMRAIERARAVASTRLTGLQADWYSPAAIMKLVGSGVASMAGMGKMFSTGGRFNQKVRNTVVDPAKGMQRGVTRKGRMKFDSQGRRVY